MFLVTKATDRQQVNPDRLVLAQTRLREFLVEKVLSSFFLSIHDSIREKLTSRELYPLVHVIFSETEIEVHLHKKFYLSKC